MSQSTKNEVLPDFWLQTASGKQWWILHPKAELVDLHDMAISLGRLARFNGHTKDDGRRPYSVAQHSLLVGAYVPPEYRLEALFHDGKEYIVGDRVTPLKWAIAHQSTEAARILSNIEDLTQCAIHQRFGLDWPLAPQADAIINDADLRALMTEKRDLLEAAPDDWGIKADPFMERIEYVMSADEAARAFESAVRAELDARGLD